MAEPQEDVSHKHAVIDAQGGVVSSLRGDPEPVAIGNPDKIQRFKQSLAVEGSDLVAFAQEAEAGGAAQAQAAALATGWDAFGGPAGGGDGDRPVCCVCLVPDMSGYGRTGQGVHKNAHKGARVSISLPRLAHFVPCA